MKKIVLLLSFWMGYQVTLYSKPEYSKELSQLHENLFTDILEDSVNIAGVEKSLVSMSSNGSWPDIVYEDKIDGPWKTINHLNRLLNLCKAYRTKGSKLYADRTISPKIHLALNYWLDHNFQSPFSWWYNEIGTPGTLGSILVLMEDELNEKQIKAGIGILNRSQIKYTGENKVWVSGIVLTKALLQKDIPAIKIASASIQEELKISTGEGIQPDWSFHQHGPQLQLGNYGLGFAGDMIKWIHMLRDTPFAFDENKIEILRNYLLQGLGWADWKGKFDIPALGRKLLKNSASQRSEEYSQLLKSMSKLDPLHAREYNRALNQDTSYGLKYFWSSEYLVKRTPDYFFSLRMVSKRVKGAESSRFENVNGYYMGDGLTLLYQKGDEYDDIYPYWNWKKLPGTTLRQDDKKLPLLLAKGYFTGNEFVGGVTDGQDGMAVMDYSRDGLEAKKAWFLFNDMIICLGAGINSSEKNNPIVTTINQSFCRGNVLVKDQGKAKIASEGELHPDSHWILHDHTGYFFPHLGNIVLETKSIEEKWSNVSTQYVDDEKHSAKIFQLSINHGANSTNGSYCYSIVPNSSQSRMEGMSRSNPFLCSNTKKIQEVISKDGTEGFIFYQSGKSSLLKGITADNPCLIMRKRDHKGYRIYVADPSQKLSELTLEFEGRYQTLNSIVREGKTIVKVSLPQKGEAGKTVYFSLKKI